MIIVYNPFNVLLWFACVLFKTSMSVVVEDICNFLVVSLPVFGISVKVFKIYAGCKKKWIICCNILWFGTEHKEYYLILLILNSCYLIILKLRLNLIIETSISLKIHPPIIKYY